MGLLCTLNLVLADLIGFLENDVWADISLSVTLACNIKTGSASS